MHIIHDLIGKSRINLKKKCNQNNEIRLHNDNETHNKWKY